MGGTATTDNNKGLSDRFVQIKIVTEPGVAKTANTLDNPPSKVRDLWFIKLVTE
jgi:hypothetical protein